MYNRNTMNNEKRVMKTAIFTKESSKEAEKMIKDVFPKKGERIIGKLDIQLKAKDVKKPPAKSKARIKLEADRIKGDFDVFLKDSHNVGYDDDDDDEFM